MSLSNQERKELHEAIMDAYPNRDTFKQMMSYELNENLDAISTNDSYNTVIFEVIENFNSKGRKIFEFVEKAHEFNPHNQKLKICHEKWCVNTSSNEGETESSTLTQNGKKQEPSEKEPSNNPTGEKDSNNPNQPVDTSETIEQRIEHLSQLLENNKWKEADAETSNILFQAVEKEKKDGLQEKDIKKLDCKLLLEIDKLWREKSDNRFGFRVQKEVWEQLQKNFKSNLSDKEKQKQFGKRLDWYVDEKGGTGRWISRVEINPSWGFYKPIRGYLPTPPPCIQGKYPIKVHLTLALVEKLKRCQQELRN